MRTHNTTGAFCAVLLLALAGAAQTGADKRSLTHADYDGWNSISSPTLSRDGKHLGYGLFPQEGDGFVVVRGLPAGREWRHPAGALPPPPATPVDEPSPERAAPRGVRLAFTEDGRYLVSTTFPPRAETERGRKARKKPEEMPKGGLLVIDTATGEAVRVEGVKSMQVPARGASLVAYLKEGAPDAAPKKPEEGEPAARAKKKEYGTDLVLRLLGAGSERTFPGVVEYALARDGRTLVYAVSAKNEEENGVYAVDTAAGGTPVALAKGKGKYAKLAWDRGNRRLAFLGGPEDTAAKQPRLGLYLWERGAATAFQAAGAEVCNQGRLLSDKGAVAFSRDGSRVFAGCAPPAPPAPAAAPADDKVLADLWHWKDDFVQPMQKVRAARDRNRTYTGVYHVAEKRFVPLAEPALPQVFPSDDGRYAIGADDRPYRRAIDFDGTYADEYIVDTITGTRTRAVEKLRSGPGSPVEWSPDGKYALFYRDRHWQTLAIPGGVLTTITSGVPADFYNEDDDRPEPPSAWGNAGWTSDSRWVLLYDRWDVWRISPDGLTVHNLTEGCGRRHNIQFRVVRLDPDDEDGPRGIDPAKPLLLRAENLATRDTGFFQDRLEDDAPPRQLIMGAKNFRTVAKARESDVVALTASTFHEFPDIQVTDSSFARLAKATDANPQKAGLLWGTGELVRFKNADGVPLQAALYKPENFDPTKKYPLLVYVYERLSQNVHAFVDPRPGTSINIAWYVSNGYLVLTPDIVYTVGAPGQSALKCVLPAIQAVVDRGFVNEEAIGIQGHSWGGYQVAYLVGHTARFRAAEAGAPVGNMTSAYNGIRWGSGMPRQFQYEKTQSRIGGSLWESPMQYIENSPIFSAAHVRTPLLILHDDQDDAVPWYQGIELFLSLRRLGKEAYLFNYNGEMHGLRRRHNQKDYTVRMQQFFDHFLKGAPEPAWMRTGIPYLEREEEKTHLKKGA